MSEDVPRTKQQSRTKSATQRKDKPLPGQAAHAPSLLGQRKSLEMPQQKFDRLLSEGHRAQKKQIATGDSATSTHLEVVSPEGAVEILWEPHEEVRSGAFVAVVAEKSHKIDAKLEDEAVSRIDNFSGDGKVTTHVLPLGEIGDTAYFDAVNSTTGQSAVARATTHLIPGLASIGSWIKSLFS